MMDSLLTVFYWVAGGIVLLVLFYQVGKLLFDKDDFFYLSASSIKPFVEHYRNQGVRDKTIQLVLHHTRNLVGRDEFNPKPEHVFRGDYGWIGTLADQYSTYPMMLDGLTIEKIGVISISEDDWESYQKEEGVIDTFDDLFKYINWKVRHLKNRDHWFDYGDENV